MWKLSFCSVRRCPTSHILILCCFVFSWYTVFKSSEGWSSTSSLCNKELLNIFTIQTPIAWRNLVYMLLVVLIVFCWVKVWWFLCYLAFHAWSQKLLKYERKKCSFHSCMYIHKKKPRQTSPAKEQVLLYNLLVTKFSIKSTSHKTIKMMWSTSYLKGCLLLSRYSLQHW